MAGKSTYEIDLLVRIEKALKSVEELQEKSNKKLGSISMSTAFSAMVDGFRAVQATAEAAFRVVSDVVAKSVAEALEAERAQFRLANALRLTGDAGGGALANFERLAKSLQLTTTFGDDATLAAVGLAKQFSLTNKETERAIVVAQDLAAATGKDLNTAMQEVAQSFNGFVSRDLAKMIPGLKNLSAEALLSGAALEKIGERVKGTAAAFSDTFGGVLIQTNNAINDVLETLGKLFTDNAAIKAGLKVVRDAFTALNMELEKNSDLLKEIVTEGFIILVNVVPIVATAIKNITTNFTALYFAGKAVGVVLGAIGAAVASLLSGARAGEGASIFSAMKEDLEDLQVEFGKALNRQDALFDPLIRSTQKMAENVGKAAKETKSLGTEINKLDKSTTGFAARFSEKFGPEQIQAFTQRIASLRATLDDEVRAKVNQIASTPLSGVIQLAIRGQEELDKAKAKIDATINEIANNKDIPEAFRKQARELGEGAKKGLEEAFSSKNVGIQFATTLIGAVRKGAAGAAEAVSEVAGGVATAFFGPVVGGLVKELTSFLAQGPELVKKQIQEFAAAIPDVIANIITAIPAVIEAFAEAVPEIVDKFIEKVPQIVEALARGMPKAAIALALEMPRVAVALVTGIVKNIPEIVKGFVSGLTSAAGEFVDALIDAVTGGAKSIGNGLTGGGDSDSIFAGIPILQGIGDIFGFADGGRTTRNPRLSGDRGLVRIGPNEQTFSGDLTDRMENFLDRSESSGGDIIQVTHQTVIGRRVLAEEMFEIRRAGYRT